LPGFFDRHVFRLALFLGGIKQDYNTVAEFLYDLILDDVQQKHRSLYGESMSMGQKESVRDIFNRAGGWHHRSELESVDLQMVDLNLESNEFIELVGKTHGPEDETLTLIVTDETPKSVKAHIRALYAETGSQNLNNLINGFINGSVKIVVGKDEVMGEDGTIHAQKLIEMSSINKRNIQSLQITTQNASIWDLRGVNESQIIVNFLLWISDEVMFLVPSSEIGKALKDLRLISHQA